MIGTLNIQKFNGIEIKPGIILIGDPTPIEGTNKLKCLANVFGCLALVELSIKFIKESD